MESLKLICHSILGGGTAGLAIAGRLASNPNISVAVIEAGGFYEIDNGNGSVIPAFAALQHIGSQPNDTQPLIDWGLVTVPQAVRAYLSTNTQRALRSIRVPTIVGCIMHEVRRLAGLPQDIFLHIIGKDLLVEIRGQESQLRYAQGNQWLLSTMG